jgi:hypothetical protein
MSPQAHHPTTGRYQSQFLNFINRHSQRLRDQSAQWLRQLKIASIWGGQLALYPIYALFQAGRLAGHQLRSQSPTTPALTIADRPQLAAPVRLFYQLMTWVQHGPIAHQIDWFDETSLVATPQSDWFQPHFGQLPSDALLLRLNGVTNFDWQTWSQDLPQTSPFTQWLKAAIAYFFGRTPASLPTAAPDQMADLWDIALDATPIAATDRPIAIPMVEFQLPGCDTPQVLQPTATRPALPTQAQSRSGTTPNLTWANVFGHDLTTTLIDTVATPIGYIQHPLERLLGWLDQAILWLETQIHQLWQWLQTQRAKSTHRRHHSD